MDELFKPGDIVWFDHTSQAMRWFKPNTAYTLGTEAWNNVFCIVGTTHKADVKWMIKVNKKERKMPINYILPTYKWGNIRS